MISKIPDWLIICFWRALLGEIYPSIRAIAIAQSTNHVLTIRYYLDREPIDLDYESIEVLATNVSAAVGRDVIKHIDVDCQFAAAPVGALEVLDGFIYCRREYEL